MLIVPTKDVRRVHIRTHSCYLQTLPRVAFRLYANNLCLWNQPRASTATCASLPSNPTSCLTGAAHGTQSIYKICYWFPVAMFPQRRLASTAFVKCKD